jgi:hypothetical protein
MCNIFLIAYFLACTITTHAITLVAHNTEQVIETPTHTKFDFVLIKTRQQKMVNGNIKLPKQVNSRHIRIMDYKSTNWNRPFIKKLYEKKPLLMGLFLYIPILARGLIDLKKHSHHNRISVVGRAI